MAHRRIPFVLLGWATAALLCVPATATAAPTFSAKRADAHIRALCANGPRVEGSKAEHKAFDYLVEHLKSLGYTPKIKTVRIPKGRTSHIVTAEKPGSSDKVIVLGAHVDSKGKAPGANDNGSGVATLLELARDLKDAPTEATIRFAFFGAEEMSDSNPDHHHYGSRAYVKSLSKGQRKRIAGMVSVDMVGYGSTFCVRSMKVAKQGVVGSLRRAAGRYDLSLTFLEDFGRFGWSDHEAFERAKIPAAWLEWRRDPACHTRADKPSHVNLKRVGTSGRFLRRWLLGMTGAGLTRLRP